jgi:hypothetical protein
MLNRTKSIQFFNLEDLKVGTQGQKIIEIIIATKNIFNPIISNYTSYDTYYRSWM